MSSCENPEGKPVTADDSCQADVLLQLNNTSLYEIRSGQRVLMLQGADLLVLSLVPSEEDLAVACYNLKLPPNSLVAQPGKPLVFIICGDYKIPLCTKVPCIKESSMDFVFAVPNLFVAVSFDTSTADEVLEAFELLVKQHGVLREKKAPPRATATAGGEVARDASKPEPKLSTKIATGISFVGAVAVRGITKGADLLSKGVNHGTDKIVEHTDACKTPTQVPANIKDNIKKARVVTQSAVVLTGGISSAMIGVTAVIGDGIATRVAKHIPKTNNPHIEGAKEVGVAAIGAAGSVFVAAGDAIRTLLTASCDGVAKVVTHKMGTEAGETAANGLGLVQDAYSVQQNLKQVGVRALVRETGKQTAHYIAEQELEANAAPAPQQQPITQPQAPPPPQAPDQGQPQW